MFTLLIKRKEKYLQSYTNNTTWKEIPYGYTNMRAHTNFREIEEFNYELRERVMETNLKQCKNKDAW